MDVSRILLDLLIVLVAAKIAAEASERVGIPAVVGEIVAGIIVGPSLFHLVGRDDEVLRVLGEIGVILLLLDVGLEMDLGELRKVGRASMSVATIGVAAPMLLGYGAMLALGQTGNTALFVGAALTATSVGITARVFGDLRALATSEARIVLGAAVADDVMGLMVLTVVVRLVTEGSVSLLSVIGIVAVAVLFLVASVGVGLRVAPPLFRWVHQRATSTGTLVALAFGFTLAISELADQAKLAPIVGAFVAGLALSRTDQAERIRGELAPVGHLFIPVFFLTIGIDAEVEAFGRVSVLRDAALLLVVAAAGKMVAAVGARGTPGDTLMVGLGMLPRGEVGLIFATIGLQAGVLGPDLYASLLLVVLVTTLVTPPLLKLRSRTVMTRARAAARALGEGEDLVAPIPVAIDGEIRLPGHVDDDHALELALRSSLLARKLPASGEIVSWLAALPEGAAAGWTREEREVLLDVIERGTARSWRFLENTGVLDRALPEMADALRRHRSDPFQLDLDGAYRWPALERLRVLDVNDPSVQEARRLDHPNRLLVAALLVDALEPLPDPVGAARSLVGRIGLDLEDRREIVALVEDRHLLWAAARRSGAFNEDTVRQLAGHLETSERARAVYVLAALRGAGHEEWEQRRLSQLHDLIQDVLTRGVPDAETLDLVEERRAEVVGLVGDDERAVVRSISAPAAYLLGRDPVEVAAQLRWIEPLPPKRRFKVRSSPSPAGDGWVVEVLGRDRAGMLAAAAASLAHEGHDVSHASLVTWPDGAALEVFTVSGAHEPDAERLARRISAAIGGFIEAGPMRDVEFQFDHRASPWHSVCEIEGPERPGLLADLAAVFRAAGVTVRAATIGSHEDRAYDTFELTTVEGRKLGPDHEHLIRSLAEQGVTKPPNRFRRPATALTPVP